MKYLKSFLGLRIFLILSSTAFADIPKLINFQGVLTDTARNPLSNDTLNVEFKIYDDAAGGSIKWFETQTVITDGNGAINVLLGSITPLEDTVFNDTVRYLGIKVGTDSELTPRTRLVSVGYANRVSTVDGATGGTIYGSTSIQSDLYVDGKVGIGTTTPGAGLVVSGTDIWQSAIGIENTTFPPMEWRLGVKTDQSFNIVKVTGGTFTPLTISATTGNVGIGTTGPIADKLQVAGGSIRVDNSETIRWGNGATAIVGNTAALPYVLAFDVNGEKMRINSDGNVGIGTTSPGAPLHVSGNIFGQYLWNQNLGGGNPTGIRLTSPNRDWFVLQNLGGTASGSLTIYDYTAGQARFNISTSGNVGIGTTSPTERLHVIGDPSSQTIAKFEANNAIFSGIQVNAQNATGNPHLSFTIQGIGMASLWSSATDGSFNFRIAGTDKIKITSGGNVGIGTTSPGNILTIQQNSSTDPIADAWTTYSSAEYKEGIRELSQKEYSEALTKLLETPVVKFRYKGQTQQDKEKIGIVIEEAPTEIVSEGNPKAASLNEYISLLHAALKAQQTEIENQQAQIKKLEKTVKQLTREE